MTIDTSKRYHLISKKTNKYVSAPSYSAANNYYVVSEDWNNSLNKIWKFIPNGVNYQIQSCSQYSKFVNDKNDSISGAFLLHRNGGNGRADVYEIISGVETNSIVELISVNNSSTVCKIHLVSNNTYLTTNVNGELTWTSLSNDTDSQSWELTEASNNARVVPENGMYSLYINKFPIAICSDANYSRVNTICNRLNTLFSDPNRDLDFITPSIEDNYSCYIVCCPRVRRNQGDRTYFYHTASNPEDYYASEKLYEDTVYDTTLNASTITGIMTVMETDRPWYWALVYANRIREAVYLNFEAAVKMADRNRCTPFPMPSNLGATTASQISNPYLSCYGNVCQGAQAGSNSFCDCGTGYPNIVQNINGPGTSNGETFHPLGLTAAVSNNMLAQHMNKFVKVTSIYDPTRYVVLRLTDNGGAVGDNYIEVCDRAYRYLGKPGTGENLVTVEFMAN